MTRSNRLKFRLNYVLFVKDCALKNDSFALLGKKAFLHPSLWSKIWSSKTTPPLTAGPFSSGLRYLFDGGKV